MMTEFTNAFTADLVVACFQLASPSSGEKHDGTNYYLGTRSYSMRTDEYVAEDTDESSSQNRLDMRGTWRYTLHEETR